MVCDRPYLPSPPPLPPDLADFEIHINRPDRSSRLWSALSPYLLGTAIVAVVFGGIFVVSGGETPRFGATGGGQDAPVTAPPIDPPSIESGEPLHRLLPEVITDAAGPYTLIYHDYGDGPSFFDPCRPIYWVVNPLHEPPGAREQLEKAFADVQELTGLLFVFAGETNEPWVAIRQAPNSSYPDVESDWAPVIVWYLPEGEFEDSLDSSDPDELVAGYASAAPEFSRTKDRRLVTLTGDMTIGTEWITEMIAEGYPEQVWWLFLHEIGHILGLDHVDAPSHLMHPGGEEAEWTTTLGPGDIEGFARVGAEPCLLPSEYPTRSDWVPYGP